MERSDASDRLSARLHDLSCLLAKPSEDAATDSDLDAALESKMEGVEHTHPELNCLLCVYGLTRQKYCCLLCSKLSDICAAIKDAGDSRESTVGLLSIQQLAMIKVALDLLVVLGIAPLLYPGVGVPLAGRIKVKSMEAASGLDARLRKKRSGLKSEQPSEPACLGNVTMDRQLLVMLETIYLAWGSDQIASILQAKFLCDILGALIQICRGPRHGVSEHDKADCSPLVTSERDWAQNWMKSILQKSSPSLCIEALMVLLGPANTVPPDWLRKACSLELSKMMMRPGSIGAVFDQMLSGDGGARADEAQALSQACCIVLKKPQICQSEVYYLKHVCAQLNKLLQLKSAPTTQHMIKAALFTVGKLTELHPDLVKSEVLKNMLRPLHAIMKEKVLLDDYDVDHSEPEATEESDWIEPEEVTTLEGDDESVQPGGVLFKEGEVALSVETLHRLVCGSDPSPQFYDALGPYIPALFRLYCFTCKTKSGVRVAAQEVIASYLKISNSSTKVMLRMAIPPEIKILQHSEEDLIRSSPMCLAFAPGDSGGVEIRAVPLLERDFRHEMACLVALLKENMRHGTLAGDFMLEVLENLMNIMRGGMQGSPEYLATMQLLCYLTEELGSAVLKNVRQTLQFMKHMLKSRDEEILSLALGILSGGIAGGVIELRGDDEKNLREIESDLERLSGHDTSEVAEMAAAVRTSIMTRSSKWVAQGVDAKSSASANKVENDEASLHSDIRSVLESLRDPLLPVRAMAMRDLRKMVDNNHPAVAGRNVVKVLDIFENQIRSSDTFVYLTAMKCIADIGDAHPEEVLPRCKRMYLDASVKEDVRVKIGESMVQISHRMGITLPKYAEVVLPTFLEAAKDPSGLVRSSSVSNIGVVCKYMRYSIQNYVHRILGITAALLRSDDDVEVRRAAVVVVSDLFAGMGRDVLTRLPEVVQSCYRIVREAENRDTDEIVRVHARIALSKITEIVREFMLMNK